MNEKLSLSIGLYKQYRTLQVNSKICIRNVDTVWTVDVGRVETHGGGFTLKEGDTHCGGFPPAKWRNPLRWVFPMGFHLDNIDSPYGM